MFPLGFIEQLKQNPANRLEDVLADDGITLTQKGNSLVGYHSNKHDSASKTSLVVDVQKQLYKCFNCGEGGDVIKYLELNRNMRFTEACRYLAERAGIVLPNVDPEEQKIFEQFRQEREELEKLYDAAAEFFHSQLSDKHRKLLLDKWGLTNETVVKYKIGFAPTGKSIAQELIKRGFSRELIYRSGLLTKKRNNYFKGRLIFPYHKNGYVVYFIGRRTDDTPDLKWEKSKFKKLRTHSEKYPFISKAVSNEYFVGEDTVRRAENLLITEGVADCYAAIQAGFACISPGTVTFRKDDLPRLAVLAKQVKTVYLVNDNEDSEAGKRGALATAEYLEAQGISVKLVVLPRAEGVEKVDLADYLKSHNADDLCSLMEEAKGPFELCLDELVDDPGDAQKLQVAINMVTCVSDIEQDMRIAQIHKILKRLGVRKKTIQDMVDKVIEKGLGETNEPLDNVESDEEEIPPVEKSQAALAQTDPERVQLAERLLESPDLIAKIVNHVHKLGVAGEGELIVAVYLIGTSRLLARPLAGLVMGQSSAGKSFVIEKVGRLFPDETVLRAHHISPKALQYLPFGSLIHRFVVAGERSRIKDDVAEEGTRALREMIGDGRLSALVSVSQVVGPHKTAHIQQEGPISFIESTTFGVQEIFNEDRTRYLLLCSDEGIGQTKSIIHEIAQSASVPGDPDTPDSILALHHTAQRLLKPLDVVIPFAPELKDCLPLERIEVRRTFGHLMSLIRTVALLFQKQRQSTVNGQIIAQINDYEVVRRYLVGPLATSLGRALTLGAEELLDVLSHMGDFTVQEVEPKVTYSLGTIRSRVKELVAAGQIRQIEQAKGRSAAKYAVVKDAPVLHGLELPELQFEGAENSQVYTLRTVASKT